MATAGSKIFATDYNTAYNTMENILGPGAGQTGYGQSVVVTSVSGSTKIRKTHMDTLRDYIIQISAHQGLSQNSSWSNGNTTSIPVLPLVTTTTRLSASILNAYQNALTVMNLPQNRFALAAGQYSDELLVPLAESQRTVSWNRTVRHFFTINFGSANNARYFFNAGGTIRINPTFSKSISDQINNDWDALVNNVGTIVFGYTNTTRSGTEVSSIGFYDLNNTATQIYTRTGGSVNSLYTVNDYTIRVYCNVANNSSGGASTITFECEFKDDKPTSNPAWAPGDESVQGTLTNNVRMFRPSGSNVAVTAPSGSSSVRLDAAQI